MRGEWIEIRQRRAGRATSWSPLMRGEWIEMRFLGGCGGVSVSLPSCEGSGLKYAAVSRPLGAPASPLMRGEWIEIVLQLGAHGGRARSPLMRGEWIEISSLPCPTRARDASPLMRGEWIEINGRKSGRRRNACLPSCEGSGLKFPSPLLTTQHHSVSPHARGVD